VLGPGIRFRRPEILFSTGYAHENVTTYLVATASAATTTAACDYLEPRLEPDDQVYVLTVEEPGVPDATLSDFEEAQTRLNTVAAVRTIRREGQPDQVIVAFAREKEVDEIIMGPQRDAAPGFSTIGSTTRAVLNKVDAPVFVVPRSPE
jgi:nucleotide-binding universal stress UspA family protein